MKIKFKKIKVKLGLEAIVGKKVSKVGNKPAISKQDRDITQKVLGALLKTKPSSRK